MNAAQKTDLEVLAELHRSIEETTAQFAELSERASELVETCATHGQPLLPLVRSSVQLKLGAGPRVLRRPRRTLLGRRASVGELPRAEWVGQIPLRSEIPAQPLIQLVSAAPPAPLGFTMYQTAGVGVFNPRALSRVSL